MGRRSRGLAGPSGGHRAEAERIADRAEWYLGHARGLIESGDCDGALRIGLAAHAAAASAFRESVHIPGWRRLALPAKIMGAKREAEEIVIRAASCTRKG